VQLLPDATFTDFSRTDFQTIYNAARGRLFPTFFAADLGVGEVNVVELDGTALAWLEQQLLDGATAVIARITGPGGGDDSLFAWDSGAGPATVGEGPELSLTLGAPPATVPPLPTEVVIVATLTPTPANILTVAAEMWTATAIAETTGTPTPLPYRAVTPTPIPANIATAQALGLSDWRPSWPTHHPGQWPLRRAMRGMRPPWRLPRARSRPSPPTRVTPVVILPTPMPKNVETAAHRCSPRPARQPPSAR
jgi:hypothetical protein